MSSARETALNRTPTDASPTGPGSDRPPAPLEGSIPVGVKLLALSARLIGPLAPGLAGRLAYRLWFRTVRPPDPPSALPVLQAAERWRTNVEGIPVATYAWGEGSRVLLVHGWGSHTGHMTGFVAPLVERGFRVVAFDAPGHGRSPGKETEIFEFRETLRAVADRTGGPPTGAVAHSLGSLALLDAQSSGLGVEACVLVSPGIRLDALVGAFRGRTGLTARAAAELQRRVAAFVGPDFYDGLWETSPDRALVLHDEEDGEIPLREARHVARKLDGAPLLTTAGLGHRKILRAPDVHEETARFLALAPCAHLRPEGST